VCVADTLLLCPVVACLLWLFLCALQSQAVLFAFTTTPDSQLKVMAWQTNNTSKGAHTHFCSLPAAQASLLFGLASICVFVDALPRHQHMAPVNTGVCQPGRDALSS
jgi:hypothetical protein